MTCICKLSYVHVVVLFKNNKEIILTQVMHMHSLHSVYLRSPYLISGESRT